MNQKFFAKGIHSIFLMLCLLIASSAFAQNTSNTDIVFERNANTSPLKKIVFKDSTGNIEGEFDTNANNPFKNVRGDIIKESQDGDIKEISALSIAPSFAPPSSKSSNDTDQNIYLKYSKVVMHPLTTRQGKTKGAVYTLRLYNENFEERGSKAQFQILDNAGNITKKIDVNTDVLQSVVTDDGRYFGFNFGGIVDHNDYKVHDDGFCIYDTKTGENYWKCMQTALSSHHRPWESRS